MNFAQIPTELIWISSPYTHKLLFIELGVLCMEREQNITESICCVNGTLVYVQEL